MGWRVTHSDLCSVRRMRSKRGYTTLTCMHTVIHQGDELHSYLCAFCKPHSHVFGARKEIMILECWVNDTIRHWWGLLNSD